MQAVVVQAVDLLPEGVLFFAGAHVLTGETVAGDGTEDTALGVGAHHSLRLFGVRRGVQVRLGLEGIASYRSTDAAGELQHAGEQQALLAGGIIPAVQSKNHLTDKAILVFGTLETGSNLGVVVLFLQDREVVQHLRLLLRSATVQVSEVQLDEAIGVSVLEVLSLVQTALGHLTHQLTQTQVTTLEEGLRLYQPLAGPEVYWSTSICL